MGELAPLLERARAALWPSDVSLMAASHEMLLQSVRLLPRTGRHDRTHATLFRMSSSEKMGAVFGS
jgi:hypothetical protein